MNHKSLQVRCSPEQPLQLLMDKLSSKSSDLYIFWQNYNQMYSQLSQKTAEVIRLKSQLDTLRRQKPQKTQNSTEDGFFRERFLHMQRSVQDFKGERLRGENRELKKQNQRYHEENVQLQSLLQQLREENGVQRNSIEKILVQLKGAQGDLNSMGRIYEQLAQKEQLLTRFTTREKELLDCIASLEGQIEEMGEQAKETKVMYEKLIRQSMQNAKNKVMDSLPSLLQTSKHRLQVISH